MKKTLTTASTAILISLAGPAWASCNVEQARLEEIISQNREMRAGYHTQALHDLRALGDAAAKLAHYRKDEACKQVIAAIQEIAENPTAATDRIAAAETQQEPMSPEAREQQRMASAKPVGELGQRIRAGEIIGAHVRDSDGEAVGRIDDIIFDAQNIPAQVVVGYGGIIGFGKEQVVVAFDSLKVTPERDVFYLSTSKEQLAEAPKFKRDQVDWIRTAEWRAKIEDLFSGGNR